MIPSAVSQLILTMLKTLYVNINTYFFISNQGHASALKIAYIFKVSGTHICSMVA